MRLSDLVGAEVFDDAGNRLDRVRDARFVATRGGEHAGQRGWRVERLVVGSGGFAERLGYAYGSVEGPALVARVMRWVARHGRFVPWERVVSCERGRVVVRGPVDDLPHPGDHGGGGDD